MGDLVHYVARKVGCEDALVAAIFAVLLRLPIEPLTGQQPAFVGRNALPAYVEETLKEAGL